MSNELTVADIVAALARGEAARRHEPRAVSARYDAAADRVLVELTNGCAFAFPPRLAAALHDAGPAQLAAVKVQASGYGLHWEGLDVDLSVPSLMFGLFGTATHMARLAGQRTSPAKVAAARANGKKGGRPRRQASS